MKQLKRFALAFAALALLAAALLCPAVSAANLDEIEKYFITVRIQPDGSAEIDYDIHWKVLDSTTAGPLEWVKVGVPNQNIEPVSHSDTIADLYSYPEGGSYVRLDLDRRYYAGETVRLEFTLHVTHLYEVYDDGSVNFEFTPGWFDEAETKQLTFTWEDGDARASYAAELEGAPVTGDLTGTPNGVQGEWTGLPEARALPLPPTTRTSPPSPPAPWTRAWTETAPTLAGAKTPRIATMRWASFCGCCSSLW